MPVLFQEATQSFPVLENLFSFHNMPFFPGELKFICFMSITWCNKNMELLRVSFDYGLFKVTQT